MLNKLQIFVLFNKIDYKQLHQGIPMLHSEQESTEFVKQPSYQKNLYPFCIVWTMLPCISWLLPWIGHTGICDNNGVIYDFLGYHINKRHMAFGNPKKYVKLDVRQNEINSYIQALKRGNQQFNQLGHNIFYNNCHHHVAEVLNLFGYRGSRNWGQISIWWMCLIQSHYVTWWAPIIVYLPFLIIATAIFLIVFFTHQ